MRMPAVRQSRPRENDLRENDLRENESAAGPMSLTCRAEKEV